MPKHNTFIQQRESNCGRWQGLGAWSPTKSNISTHLTAAETGIEKNKV